MKNISNKVIVFKEAGEAQFDKMVYNLYDLTDEEIAYIEESVW